MDTDSIEQYIPKNPHHPQLDPFAAFGLFLTNQSTSIEFAQRNKDPTIDMLYRIYIDVYTKILDQDLKHVNELKQLNDIYYEQYENTLGLLKDDNTPRSNIINYVSQTAEYNREQKRKADELIKDDELVEYQNSDSSSENQKTNDGDQGTAADYKERMKFIEKFKEDRAKEDKMMN